MSTRKHGSLLASRLLGLAVAASLMGCLRPPSTLTGMPSTLFLRQLCPDLQYDVVGEFEESWRGNGFLGFPIGKPPSPTSYVNAEVQRYKGDAAIDVKVESDWRIVMYLFLWPDYYPRYYVSGTVIRFTDSTCHSEGS